VRELTDLIADRLHALTLGFARDEDRALVEVAERLYQREHGLARPRERESLAERLPRLQRFANGIEWLASEDPTRLDTLRHAVTRYMHMLVFFGAHEGDVPTRYRAGSVVLHAVRSVTLLAVVMPVAIVGMLFWWIPYGVTGRIAARFRPALDQVATYKIGVGIVAFPVWFVLAVTVSWLAAGWVTALIVGLAMPVAGLAAIAWRELGAATMEDVRVFRRTRGRGRVLARLADQRAALVAEFDDIGERWHDRGRPDAGPDATGPEAPPGVTTD
jgi:hypothetical protein